MVLIIITAVGEREKKRMEEIGINRVQGSSSASMSSGLTRVAETRSGVAIRVSQLRFRSHGDGGEGGHTQGLEAILPAWVLDA